MTHEVIRLLSGRRWRATSEKIVQDEIARVLNEAGLTFEREALLDSDKVDFLLEDGHAVEVKVSGSWTSIVRQLHRYASSPRVVGIVLASTRLAHMKPIAPLLGKKVYQVHLRA